MNYNVLEKSKPSILLGVIIEYLKKEETLATIFRNSAKVWSSKVALTFHEKNISYKELDEWSDSVAAFLFRNKIGNGMPVLVWLPRGIDLHVTILGIAKAGACYVPVDSDAPIERLRTISNDVKAVACFTEKLIELNCKILRPISQHTPFVENDVPITLNPDHRAYILYTSGTTGIPKGIPITHRQICHLIRAEQSIFQLLPNDKVYQGFSVSFDMWCEETWISYLVGAHLWIADAITAKSIAELTTVLENEKITILHAVPTLLANMENAVPSVRLVNSGGEACTPLVVRKWATKNRKLFNSYGPTETTVSASISELRNGDKISIGEVLPNYSMAIVDENFNPVPIGAEGELVISGIGVSLGYINWDALTKEKFIRKPSSLNMMLGERIYRSGDLVKMNNEGIVEFHGRTDDQVKLHGYRIELGEVEAKINLFDGIISAAVILKRNENERLVAFIQTEKSFVLDEVAIRQFLVNVLPSYMIPSDFIVMESLPILASGKINRKLLSSLDIKYTQQNIIDPLKLSDDTTVEQKVLYYLKQTFPNQNVLLAHDFFNDLGGDSLNAAVFVSEIRSSAKINNASFKDIYLHRPLYKLVECWEIIAEETKKVKEEFHPVSRLS